MVSGPVGFAEMNSTWMRLPWRAVVRPKSVPSRTISSIWRASHAVSSRTFTNPFSSSTEAIGGATRTRSRIAFAMSRGLFRTALLRRSATLDA